MRDKTKDRRRAAKDVLSMAGSVENSDAQLIN